MSTEDTRRKAEEALEKYKSEIPGNGFPLPTSFEEGWIACYGVQAGDIESLKTEVFRLKSLVHDLNVARKAEIQRR